MFKSKVTSNTQALSGLIRRAKNLGTQVVETGYYEDQIHPKWHMSLSSIALINERGYFGIPARNFMWQSFVSWSMSRNTNAKALATSFVYRKGNWKKELKDIGEDMRESIKWTIAYEGHFQDNSPMTISYKGFNYPLVNTGYLRDHAKTKVRKE